MRQHVGADVGQIGLQVAEAPGTQQQLPHDQQRPAFPDQIEGMAAAQTSSWTGLGGSPSSAHSVQYLQLG
ncbi:hypothetical protein [Deinococcus aetherius]|uniref:hypothetical protein n=1 Tax=Deinococcus aetherius TaxID=200252 RepID=UPI0031E88AD5